VEILRKGLIVTDTIYNPKKTKLLRETKSAGCTAIDGVGMLVYQGAAAFKLFTGADMPVDKVRSLFFNLFAPNSYDNIKKPLGNSQRFF